MNIGKMDVVWGYLSLLLVQGINGLLLPFVLLYLNQAELGLWYTFTALYGFVMLMDFGLKPTITRHITYVWAGAKEIKSSGYNNVDADSKLDKNFFVKVISTIKVIYYVLGMIVFLLLSTVGTLYIVEISKNQIEIQTVLIAWLIYFLSIILNIAFSFWGSLLKGIGGVKNYNQSLVVSKLVQLILSIILLVQGAGIIGISIAYLSSVIVSRILLTYFFYNYDKKIIELKGLIKARLEKQIFKALIPNTFKIGLVSISNYLVIGFPIILISYYSTLETSGQFGLAFQIVTLIIALSNSYFNTFLPQFNYYRVRNENYKLFNLFKKAIRNNYLINFIGFILLLLLGEFVINLIAPEQDLPSTIFLVVIVIYRFLYNNQILFTAILTTKNDVPFYKSFLISALLTVSLQILILQFGNLEILGIILTLLIVQLAFNNWYWPIKVIKDLRNDLNRENLANE